MSRTLVFLALLTLGCDDDKTCHDSVVVIESSVLVGPQGAHCSHPNHTMKTEQIGLTRGSVKVTCTCKSP